MLKITGSKEASRVDTLMIRLDKIPVFKNDTATEAK